MKNAPTYKRLFTVGLWLALIVGNTINLQAQVNHMLGLSAMSSFQRLEAVDEINRNTIRVGMYMDYTSQNSWLYRENIIQSLSPQIEYSRQWTPRFSTDLRLSGYSHSGVRDQTVRGLGDLFMIGNYRLTSRVGILFGVKTPLSDGNRKDSKGVTLPLGYQPTTGTFDLIAGVSAQVWRLQVFAAWQQPLTRSDFNYPSYYNSHPIECAFPPFYVRPDTPDKENRFQRAGQLFLRMKAPMNLGSGWVLSPGLAFQGSIEDDRYLDWENGHKSLETQYFSALSLDMDIPINKKAYIHCMIAAPPEPILCEPNFYNFLFGGLEYRYRF